MTKVASKLERVVSQLTTPPERIHGWQHTQMSIARHYGGLKYNDHDYTIAINEEGRPLVRNDVLKREYKAGIQAIKDKRKNGKQRAAEAQEGLI